MIQGFTTSYPPHSLATLKWKTTDINTDLFTFVLRVKLKEKTCPCSLDRTVWLYVRLTPYSPNIIFDSLISILAVNPDLLNIASISFIIFFIEGHLFFRISLSGNYIRINCANPGVYQYHVDFRPMVDSKNIRFKLLNEHRDVIGNVKAFDGNILYLPIRLPNQVIISWCF